MRGLAPNIGRSDANTPRPLPIVDRITAAAAESRTAEFCAASPEWHRASSTTVRLAAERRLDQSLNSLVGLQLSWPLLLMLYRLFDIPSSVLLVSNVRGCSGSPKKGSVKRDVTFAFSGGLSRGN